MTVRAVGSAIVPLRNASGQFILPCKKITLRYCNWGGSSKGLREFIMSQKFVNFAKNNKSIELHLVKQSGHPVVTGHYLNGGTKPICVKNMNLDVVNNKLELLRNASGDKLSKTKQAVESINESARGIWSPFHVQEEEKYRV